MAYIKKFPRIIIFFAAIFLFLGLGLVYNQSKKTLAQEDIGQVVDCGDEIPLGEAVDDTFALIEAIDRNIQTVYSSSLAQIEAAKDLVNLPEDCSVDFCETECDMLWIDDGDGVPGPGDTYECKGVLPCSPIPGSNYACPDEIDTLVSAIQASNDNIGGAIGSIEDTLEIKVDPMFGGAYIEAIEEIELKLKEVREALEDCIMPSSVLTEEELGGKWLFNCEEAKFQKILTEDKEDCHPTNFFCCE